jgi:hypothetical protein
VPAVRTGEAVEKADSAVGVMRTPNPVCRSANSRCYPVVPSLRMASSSSRVMLIRCIIAVLSGGGTRPEGKLWGSCDTPVDTATRRYTLLSL